VDPLLRPFVESPDEGEAARQLDVLIERHALPLARAIAGRKLRAYRNEGPAAAAARDREDVVADAMVTLVQRLRAARESAEDAAIENFAAYAAAVVHSAYAHHIRRHYPARARLKNRLRYVFSTDRHLALWTNDDELVCGLAEWSGARADSAADRRMTDILDADQQPWDSMNRRALAAALVELVRSAGAPVDFEALVGAVASAARVIEPSETGGADLAAVSEPPPELRIDQHRFLARVWDEVRQLPVRQRIALLLNLRDPHGAGLLWLLPIAGIATIRQIAGVLEIRDAELAGLWREIPLDDTTIGKRLGCTRQQVINLRMAARKRLANRLGAAAPWSIGVRPGGANLRPVSASLKGSA
jgi:RNA polymerase sigma factor (sigma-70 family)